jgi:hypothetical protein
MKVSFEAFRCVGTCLDHDQGQLRKFRHFSFCDPSAAFSAGLSSEQNKEPKAMAHFTPVE